MTSTHGPAAPATNVFAQRMARAAVQAADAGLTGVLVTPGPDLLYFTGYASVAITEDGGRRLKNTSHEMRVVA